MDRSYKVLLELTGNRTSQGVPHHVFLFCFISFRSSMIERSWGGFAARKIPLITQAKSWSVLLATHWLSYSRQVTPPQKSNSISASLPPIGQQVKLLWSPPSSVSECIENTVRDGKTDSVSLWNISLLTLLWVNCHSFTTDMYKMWLSSGCN